MVKQEIHAQAELTQIKTNALTEVACAVSKLREGKAEVPIAVAKPIMTVIDNSQKGQTEVAQAVPRPIPSSGRADKKS